MTLDIDQQNFLSFKEMYLKESLGDFKIEDPSDDDSGEKKDINYLDKA